MLQIVEQRQTVKQDGAVKRAGFHQSRVTNHQSQLLGDSLRKFYGQAERPISTGQLRALLHFHLPPIKVVVFDRSS